MLTLVAGNIFTIISILTQTQSQLITTHAPLKALFPNGTSANDFFTTEMSMGSVSVDPLPNTGEFLSSPGCSSGFWTPKCVESVGGALESPSGTGGGFGSTSGARRGFNAGSRGLLDARCKSGEIYSRLLSRCMEPFNFGRTKPVG